MVVVPRCTRCHRPALAANSCGSVHLTLTTWLSLRMDTTLSALLHGRDRGTGLQRGRARTETHLAAEQMLTASTLSQRFHSYLKPGWVSKCNSDKLNTIHKLQISYCAMLHNQESLWRAAERVWLLPTSAQRKVTEDGVCYLYTWSDSSVIASRIQPILNTLLRGLKV